MEITFVTEVFREGSHVEITYENAIWGEVWYDSTKEVFIVEIGSSSPKFPRTLTLPLDEMQQALGRAKERLMKEGYGQQTQ